MFAPKDKLGDWLEMYTKVMELNYWTRTTCQIGAPTTRHAANGRLWWTATAKRLSLKPKQLVLATGMSGKDRMPDFPGMETFKGEQQHSSRASRT